MAEARRDLISVPWLTVGMLPGAVRDEWGFPQSYWGGLYGERCSVERGCYSAC